jgi:hypothetical protein
MAARDGSGKRKTFAAAVEYVVDEQGSAMSVFNECE